MYAVKSAYEKCFYRQISQKKQLMQKSGFRNMYNLKKTGNNFLVKIAAAREESFARCLQKSDDDRQNI